MKLITVEATFAQGKTEEAISAFQNTADGVRRMAGCLGYEIYRAPAEGDAAVIVQKWESMADFDAYRSSADFAAMGAQLKPLMAGPPETTIADTAG